MVNEVTAGQECKSKIDIKTLTLFTEYRLKLGDILEYRDELRHDGPDHCRVFLVWVKLEIGDVGERNRGK
jgi:hypothetical protein